MILNTGDTVAIEAKCKVHLCITYTYGASFRAVFRTLLKDKQEVVPNNELQANI